MVGDQGQGSVRYDARRKTWRIAVIVDGQRIYRRAHTRAEAEALRAQLIRARREDVWARFDMVNRTLDVSDLTDQQIGLLIEIIRSWLR